jgi:hypothetical protein
MVSTLLRRVATLTLHGGHRQGNVAVRNLYFGWLGIAPTTVAVNDSISLGRPPGI